MKQLYKEGDFSIAWFKLALLVSRKEKEKALSLYKLLFYSFENKAYTLQIEGDLLHSFEDKEALVKYQQAALLYKSEKNMAAALGIYEHLLALQPQNPAYLTMLFELYARLDLRENLSACIEKLLTLIAEGVVVKQQSAAIVKPAIDVFYENNNGEALTFFRLLLEKGEPVLDGLYKTI